MSGPDGLRLGTDVSVEVPRGSPVWWGREVPTVRTRSAGAGGWTIEPSVCLGCGSAHGEPAAVEDEEAVEEPCAWFVADRDPSAQRGMEGGFEPATDVELPERAPEEEDPGAPHDLPDGTAPMSPPPFLGLLAETQACFASAWGSVDDYPPQPCVSPERSVQPCAVPGPGITVGSRGLPPMERLVEHAWFDTRRSGMKARCPPLVQQTPVYRDEVWLLLELALRLLRANLDIVRWATCLPTHWSPQWRGGQPWAWSDPVRYPGRSFGDRTWRDAGVPRPDDPSSVIVSYLEAGVLDIVLVPRLREEVTVLGVDDTAREGGTSGCRDQGAMGDAINPEDQRFNPDRNDVYERAVIVPVDHPVWQNWADQRLFGSDADRLCAGVRAASTVLHELMHTVGMTWSNHLYNGCLDPCLMVERAWQYGMGQRYPCITTSGCCADVTDPAVFLSSGPGPGEYRRC